jgi:hypothetical protein
MTTSIRRCFIGAATVSLVAVLAGCGGAAMGNASPTKSTVPTTPTAPTTQTTLSAPTSSSASPTPTTSPVVHQSSAQMQQQLATINQLLNKAAGANAAADPNKSEQSEGTAP